MPEAPDAHADASLHATGERFSKKAENPARGSDSFPALQLCAVHKSLRVTPAIAAGLTDHVWSLEDRIGLLDAAEKKAA